MLNILKHMWHEMHGFFSAFKMSTLGNRAERYAAKGRLFDRKFSTEQFYINKIENYAFIVEEKEKYKKIKLGDSIYYWPTKAKIDSLWIVLSEIFFTQHPHYYNSYPTQLENGQRVLDIGACEGSFCLKAAQKVKEVVSVEPSYIMTEAMQLAAEEMNLKNIKFVVGLLGTENKKVGFQENLEAPENSLLIDNQVASEYRECWTLDTFIESHFPDGIDYIKCDAEGADFDILKSGKNALLKYKPKIVVASYHSPSDFNQIKNFLESINYNIRGQGLYYSPVLRKCYPMLLKAY